MTERPSISPALHVTLPASKRGGVAVLSMPAGTASGSFASLPHAFMQRGLVAVPDIGKDGSHILRVSGFSHASEVTRILAAQGIATQVNQLATGKRNIKNWLQENSLRISGFTYLIGDFTMIMAGLTSPSRVPGKYGEALTGAGWALGGLVSARYGHPSLMKQVTTSGVHLHDFLVSKGATISPESGLGVLKKQHNGLVERGERFLYSHPSEMHNGIYAGFAAFSLFPSGLKNYRKGDTELLRQSGKEDMAAGALVTTGGLIGGFVKEKHGPGSGPLHWVREHPLKIAAWLYMFNNFAGIKSAISRWNDPGQRRSAIFKLATALIFIVANTFMSITSRGHTSAGKDEGHKENIIEGLAAESIAKQPEERRSELTAQVAKFLSNQPETKGKAEVIEASLARKVEAMQASPWRAPAAIAAPILAAVPERAAPVWQDKVKSVPNAAPSVAF